MRSDNSESYDEIRISWRHVIKMLAVVLLKCLRQLFYNCPNHDTHDYMIFMMNASANASTTMEIMVIP